MTIRVDTKPIVLALSCTSHPEQYDAYINRESRYGTDSVGYIRLRWGILRVQCPDVGGDVVLMNAFSATPLKGQFTDNLERAYWLDKAKQAITMWLLRNEPERILLGVEYGGTYVHYHRNRRRKDHRRIAKGAEGNQEADA